MERGFWQGDPLSSFLFLLVAEGLNVMMRSLETIGLFSGYQVGRNNGVSISHLQFADDTLLLGENSWPNVWSMREMLIIFEQFLD